MSRLFRYTAFVTDDKGVEDFYWTAGSTAPAAMVTLRRSFKGRWSRIRVGMGEGAEFVPLCEVTK